MNCVCYIPDYLSSVHVSRSDSVGEKGGCVSDRLKCVCVCVCVD